MPERETIKRARRDKQEGKQPTTQAGEFVREEMHHIREGKHGATSRKQAIAIGLSKARRAGVDLPPPEQGKTQRKTRKSAAAAYRRGQQEGELSDRRTSSRSRTSQRRSTAVRNALKREGKPSLSGGRKKGTSSRRRK
jgi:hypothetical protein